MKRLKLSSTLMKEIVVRIEFISTSASRTVKYSERIPYVAQMLYRVNWHCPLNLEVIQYFIVTWIKSRTIRTLLVVIQVVLVLCMSSVHLVGSESRLSISSPHTRIFYILYLCDVPPISISLIPEQRPHLYVC